MRNKELEKKIEELNQEAFPYVGDFKTSYFKGKEEEREKADILRKAFQKKTVKNLLITANIAIIAAPIILGAGAGVFTFHALHKDSYNFKYVYYVDTEGHDEIVDYTLDKKEMFVKSPWKEENGEIVRKIYGYSKEIKEKDLEEYLSKSWDQVLAEKSFHYIREEKNNEVSSLDEIKENKGVVGCTVTKTIPKPKEEYEFTKKRETRWNIGGASIIGVAITLMGYMGVMFGELMTDGISKRKKRAKNIKNHNPYIQEAKELKKKKRRK